MSYFSFFLGHAPAFLIFLGHAPLFCVFLGHVPAFLVFLGHAPAFLIFLGHAGRGFLNITSYLLHSIKKGAIYTKRLLTFLSSYLQITLNITKCWSLGIDRCNVIHQLLHHLQFYLQVFRIIILIIPFMRIFFQII